MAKINKKSVKNSESSKKKNRSNKIETKECFVQLVKMTQKENEFYRNSDQIITKTFNLTIRDEVLCHGSNKAHSKSNTFKLELKKKLSELTLELCEPISAVKKTTAEKIPNPPSLNTFITSTWNKVKKEFQSSGQEIEVSSMVMARMKTYSPWPARCESFSINKKRATVFFFGDNRNGSVNTNEIVPISCSREVIRLLLLRKVGPFHKAVSEVEALLKIPPELSMLKEHAALK